VLNRWIEQKSEFFTTHFLAAAKVTHSRLRGGKAGLSSPPVNNFGRPIRREGRRGTEGRNQRSHAKDAKVAKEQRTAVIGVLDRRWPGLGAFERRFTAGLSVEALKR